MKIKSLTLNNFRSYIGNTNINLENKGKSLFIYGENGSGKSSICKSINDLIDASDKRRTKSIASKIFRTPFANIRTKEDKYIEICFTNGESFRFNKTGFENETFELLSKIRKLKGFLEYKNLIPIYLYSDKDKHNLFRLLVEGPLAKLKNPKTNKLIETEWNNRKKEKLTTKFYQGVFDLAKSLESKINTILKYFDSHLMIRFLARKTWTTGELYLEVFINGIKLVNYGEYFNEAKLVALTISIFLAVIYKQKEENESDACRLLILDDVFIGMDMSNRIPLLKVIEEIFTDYQVIITTFDEKWFQLSQLYLPSQNWKFIKAFSKFEQPHIPRTIIHDRTLDNYKEKAKLFFDQFDYPTAANYLRKAFEKQFKELLPFNKANHIAENGEVAPNSKLNSNYEKLVEVLKECKLDTKVLDEFSLYAKILLNPLSHDNSQSPVYRRELESAFEVLNKLEKIEKKVLRDVSGTERNILKLSVQGNDNTWYQYKYELVDNLTRYTQTINVGYLKCRIIPIASKSGNDNWIEITDGDKTFLELEYNRVCNLHSAEIKDYTKAFRTNRDITIEEL